MKNLFFGISVFIGGLIGAMSIFITSVFVPWSYNEIDGFLGFLLGTKSILPFIIFVAMFFVGLLISYNEVYKKE